MPVFDLNLAASREDDEDAEEEDVDPSVFDDDEAMD